MIAWDLETHLIQPGLLTPPVVCGSVAYEDGTAYLLPKSRAFSPVGEAISKGEVIAGANIAFDFGVQLAHNFDTLPAIWTHYEQGLVFDVSIAATLDAIYDGRLRDGELFRKDGTKIQKGRYSLEECVKEWCGREDAKKNDFWRLRYALLENKPLPEWPEEARQYPIDDARNTLEVALKQRAEAHNLQDLTIQCLTAFSLHLSSINGIRTDPKRVALFKEVTASRRKEIEEFARSRGFIRENGTKNMELIKLAVSKAYNDTPPRTPTGSVSTSREAKLESGDPDLVKFAELSSIEKQEAYIPTLEQGSVVPLNIGANVLLSTGRSSYSGMIQLIPRKGGMRECFVPRRGNVLISCDYAAIEMSTLAQVCLWSVKTSKLAQAINDGLDTHSLLAAKLAGVPYETFLATLKGHKSELQETYKGYRQAGKAANFGFPGMMSGPTFVLAKKKEGYSVCGWFGYKCGLEKDVFNIGDASHHLCVQCVAEAKKLRTFYMRQWPEISLYWNWVMLKLNSPGKRVTQFVSKRVRGGLHGPAAANTLFQGLAADGAKRAVIQMTKEMYLVPESPLYGARLFAFAHDETIIDTTPERMHEAGFRQAQIMHDEMKKCVPDVKVSVQPAAMTRWYKEAETVFDESGKLIPWEPK